MAKERQCAEAIEDQLTTLALLKGEELEFAIRRSAHIPAHLNVCTGGFGQQGLRLLMSRD